MSLGAHDGAEAAEDAQVDDLVAIETGAAGQARDHR